MCGVIGGLFRDGHVPDRSRIDQSLELIRHRGPDDSGVYCRDGVVLAARRLSIQDIAHGHQPFVSDDGNVVVIQNGEIYNHIELRHELEQMGHHFSSHCDTEVILELYLQHHLQCVNRLNGMFAIVICDRVRDEVHLIRDRLGVKPLYVASTSTGSVFGSEIKSLIQLGDLPVQMDQDALSHYLSLNYVPPPYTLFSGIRHVMPGTTLTLRSSGHVTQTWWRLADSHTDANPNSVAWNEECMHLLDDATRLRLRSDAPLGAFLSGGLDSSTVVGLASKYHDAPLPAFSIGFDDPRYDESQYARAAANRFGAALEVQTAEPDMLELWEEATYLCDQPHGDVSFLPTWVVSKLAAHSVKVVLTGDGGDELFAGYSKYADFFARCGFEFQTQEDWLSVYWPTLTLFSDEEKQKLLAGNAGTGADTYGLIEQLVRPMQHFDAVNQALAIDTMLLLPGNNLVKPDRMGMAASIEARSPFLDYRVAEFAFRTPGLDKLKNGVTKACLKEAVRPLLGSELTDRKKQMFTVPVGEWFKHDRLGWLRSQLNALNNYSVVDATVVTSMLAEHVDNQRNRTRELRALVALSFWCQRFL